MASLTADQVTTVRLGLGANWRQFSLLIAVNAFVGGMVGLERSILPGLAETEFGIASRAAVLSFIASFGVAKAVSNLVSGRLSERIGRRNLLIAGWLIGLPVPIAIMLAPAWGWIVAANLLLGINQGVCWSMTVNMKMDLAGPQRRGLALGLNETSGYLAVAFAAFLSGAIADRYGLRPAPFFLGIAFAGAGLALTVLWVRDTGRFVAHEASGIAARQQTVPLRDALAAVTWRRRRLAGPAQAGFVNNLNDGVAWGLFPLLFAARGLDLKEIAVLAAIYPLVWAVLQVFTGLVSDSIGRRPLIVVGMLLQAGAIAAIGLLSGFGPLMAAAALLGIGTAMVYPTLLAAIGDETAPRERATVLGAYRFWRDAGFVAGALLAGSLADLFGFNVAVQAVAALTAGSGVAAMVMMRPRASPSPSADPSLRSG
ncbi:MAG: MFS transporter [Chloroflexi bacterium]|nr:MFS transporter [Chloroflexota bacterium]